MLNSCYQFNELELSVLFSCLSSKRDDKTLNRNLESIINRHQTMVDGYLYRGITQEEMPLINKACETREPFSFGRVTSVSECDYIASSFCNKLSYATNTLLRIKVDKAFCYYQIMLEALKLASDDYFICTEKEASTALRREEKIDMVMDELEWMISGKKEFIVTDTKFDGDLYIITCNSIQQL